MFNLIQKLICVLVLIGISACSSKGLLSILSGQWKVNDWQIKNDGTWQALNGAQWTFTPIQKGNGLKDEWVSYSSDKVSPSGYGNGLRSFNPVNKVWQAAWLSSRSGEMEHYVGEEKNGEVVFTSKQAINGRLSRNVFSQVTPQTFNWRIEWSRDDGANWLTVYRVEASR